MSVRRKVETTGANDPGNAVRFGQQFIGRIANPKDVLQYHKKKLGAKKGERC
jgi:double-strand break repair protein MRE11